MDNSTNLENTELFTHRQYWFSFEVCSIWHTSMISRWRGEEKQTWLYTQILTWRSDIKIIGLRINTHKVIDTTRISKLVERKSKKVCEVKRETGLGNSIKHKYLECTKDINMFIRRYKNNNEET